MSLMSRPTITRFSELKIEIIKIRSRLSIIVVHDNTSIAFFVLFSQTV